MSSVQREGDAWGGSITIRNVSGAPIIVDPAECTQTQIVVESALGVEKCECSALKSSGTAWVPGTNDAGLIEAMDRRGGTAAASFLLLATRPREELEGNFRDYSSTPTNLNSPRYLLSHAERAITALEGAIEDSASIPLKDVLSSMQQGTQNFGIDHYYLVSYQDYSLYASYEYFLERRRENWFQPSYVVRYFSIRVGPNQGGVLIPISESQFLLGSELITTEILRGCRSSSQIYLTREEFLKLTSSGDANANETSSVFHTAAVSSGFGGETGYRAPVATNMNRRLELLWNRWLMMRNEYYVKFGRVALKVLITGGILIMIRQRLKFSSTKPRLENSHSKSYVNEPMSSSILFRSMFPFLINGKETAMYY